MMSPPKDDLYREVFKMFRVFHSGQIVSCLRRKVYIPSSADVAGKTSCLDPLNLGALNN